MESERAKNFEGRSPVFTQPEASHQELKEIMESNTDNPYELYSNNYKDFKSATIDMHQYLSFRQSLENKNKIVSRASPIIDEPYSKNLQTNNLTHANHKQS